MVRHSIRPGLTAIANFAVPIDPGGLMLRAATPAADPVSVAALLATVSKRAGWQAQQLGLAEPGIVCSCWPVADQPAAQVAAALTEARRALVSQGGYLVVEALPTGLSLDRGGQRPRVLR